MLRKLIKKAARKVKRDNERGARENVLEELFQDFNRSRFQVYKMNFVRGIFFGLGSVIGGTVIIALLAWVLHFFVEIPGIGRPIQNVQDTIQQDKK